MEGGIKRCRYVQMYLHYIHHPPSAGISRFCMKSALKLLLKYTKNCPELFVPLSALASYSQTPGPFAEPLVPSSHIPQIKITYLVFTDLCFGAPPLLGSIEGNH